MITTPYIAAYFDLNETHEKILHALAPILIPIIVAPFPISAIIGIILMIYLYGDNNNLEEKYR